MLIGKEEGRWHGFLALSRGSRPLQQRVGGDTKKQQNRTAWSHANINQCPPHATRVLIQGSKYSRLRYTWYIVEVRGGVTAFKLTSYILSHKAFLLLFLWVERKTFSPPPPAKQFLGERKENPPPPHTLSLSFPPSNQIFSFFVRSLQLCFRV